MEIKPPTLDKNRNRYDEERLEKWIERVIVVAWVLTLFGVLVAIWMMERRG